MSAQTRLRARILALTEQLTVPLRVLAAVGALAVGALLIFAPLSVQHVALITGLGIAVVGLVTIMRDPDHGGASGRQLSRWVGRLLIALGSVMALWPDSGAPWLAFLVGSALLLRGFLSGAEALRAQSTRSADRRIAGIFSAAATFLIGAITFSWPVLTLSIFRYALGAWLAFVGFQVLLSVCMRRLTPSKPAAEAIVNGSSEGAAERASKRWASTIGAALALLLAGSATAGSAIVLGGARAVAQRYALR